MGANVLTEPFVDEEGVRYEPLGTCPCGREVHYNLEQSSLLHQLPMCSAFERLDPADFATYMRRSRGIPDSLVDEN